ncbi:hypothetical protein HTZ77_40410 [Nonomuraea sp. SMC257]|uniref:DUF3806 domain-containing protein n=1 Tax=Nonomuraea montanisoli TaxID=2741721 RepID=A0A7Y6M8Q5_9ACTN|nr:hypothetical protein [Nonomuraea montanisoli]NUW37624.1 hypothetical protein [Nonomuraea montanisoli]
MIRINIEETTMGAKAQQDPPPSDAETAAHMRDLAELFVEHSRADGYSFDWDPAFIHHLDNYCTEFVAAKPSPEVTHSVILSAGAYLGEMIVRTCGWRWVYCTNEKAAAVESPDGVRGYPHNKVAKRIHEGTTHDLEAFFKYAATGEAPRGSAARVTKPSWWRRLRSRS